MIDLRASELPAFELSGKVVDGEHHYPLRIFYEDTDAGGIVYHSRYLQFAERARTELLRLAGIEQSKLRDSHNIVFAVHRCEVDYRRPARLDDLVEVRSRFTELRGARLGALQSICRAGEELVRLVVVVASVNGDGRPARIPAPIRAALEPFIQPLKQG
ncbi:tol-pal system-associated acyl-CoA thioesterase [Pelagibius marinus]|uniref:tol-pal system-associated acyl-CoA thioesterase n=1 Tax=Pelagibius marinus TaxID=2762760 RepID=UPI001D046798|nr:tol-pal system-associated acyl-CoA thioesterase [Pelagibius marinus]